MSNDTARKRRPGAGRAARNLSRLAWVFIGGGAALVLIIVLIVLLLI
jgi:hypothetical protein